MARMYRLVSLWVRCVTACSFKSWLAISTAENAVNMTDPVTKTPKVLLVTFDSREKAGDLTNGGRVGTQINLGHRLEIFNTGALNVTNQELSHDMTLEADAVNVTNQELSRGVTCLCSRECKPFPLELSCAVPWSEQRVRLIAINPECPGGSEKLLIRRAATNTSCMKRQVHTS